MVTSADSPTISVLMAAHVVEVFVWALAYLIFDTAPAGASLVYFAFVNYATLGYGDVLPVERWRLLGPLTAMNGMLLFGWSTAVIFEVLRRTLVRTLDIKCMSAFGTKRTSRSRVPMSAFGGKADIN